MRRRIVYPVCLALLLTAWGGALAAPGGNTTVFVPLVFGASGPTLAGCPSFPADNPLNADISGLPLHPRSADYIASMTSNGARFLHADFGENQDYGIPFSIVGAAQATTPVVFTDYGDESDPGPYPIGLGAPIEAGSDRHVLVAQQGTCKLYELFNAAPTDGAWYASSGAIFDLRSNALRPAGWTSADAAGLPILPLLVRYDEVAAGRIEHALRVTVKRSQRGYIAPARHFAGTSDGTLPPMGLRLRLKASFDLTPYRGQSLVILTALKRYGLIVADNGSDWFISGGTDPRWSDADLEQLKGVPASAFEAVNSGPIVTR